MVTLLVPDKKREELLMTDAPPDSGHEIKGDVTMKY